MNTSKSFRLAWALGGVAAALSLSACSLQKKSTDAAQASTASSSNPAPNGSQADLIETIYVPGMDDKLHPKPVSFKSIEVPASALQELISTSAPWFPKGAKVNNITATDKQITVDVNKAFSQASFWGEHGENGTSLAVYAIVNSASGKTKKPVQLTVEGVPISTLGDFDASDAIEPNPDLIVGKPAPTTSATLPPVTPTKTPAVPTPVPSTAKQAQPTTPPRT